MNVTGKLFYMALLVLASESGGASAQTLTTLHSFTPSEAEFPSSALVQGSDGNFYGASINGGTGFCEYGCGTVFKISPTGAFQPLYSFTGGNAFGSGGGTDGAFPNGLFRGSDGNFYGTTQQGGTNYCGCGTVFKISPAGVLTTLYSFADGTDFGFPQAGLVQGSDGYFYGTTSDSEIQAGGMSSMFNISSAGTLNTVYYFGGQSQGYDGVQPSTLVLGSDGYFHGTTYYGGTSANCGTVFKISPGGGLITLYSFGGADGDFPLAALVQGSGGYFYGTTYYGGTSTNCSGGCGTIFKISPAGALTTLHSFTGGADGAHPKTGALVQGGDGYFYGTTPGGIITNCGGFGTVFRIGPAGGLTTLYSFTGGADGGSPYAGLVQGSDGNFYGTTVHGGANGDGTVFKITLAGASAITGQISCTCDGSPITDAYVQIGCLAATSDDSGNYSIFASPGTYSVTVSKAFYSTTNCMVTIPSGSSTVTQNFTLKPDALDYTLLNAIVPALNVQPSPVNNGTAFQVIFTPGMGLSVTQAACRLGFDHFNWLQEASSSSYDYDPTKNPYGPNCSPTTSPWFIDPPHQLCNGTLNCIRTSDTTCENVDTLRYYYNEGAAYPGAFNITNHIIDAGMELQFYDHPSIDPNDIAYFVTDLVGVNANGTFAFLRGHGWTSNHSGTIGGVTVICASLLEDTNGTGGVVSIQTNLFPADIPTGATALMLQGGGSFPVTIQPSTQSVAVGAAATFSIVASNSAPFSYQWRRNKVNLTGATSATLALSPVTDSIAGVYDAILTDTNGSIGSSTAILTVGGGSVGDGIPDAWRGRYFPNVDPTGMTTDDLSCATCDADGTGQNNLLKYLAGLNPTNSTAYLHIISIAKTNTTGIKVIYLGANGDGTWSPGIAARTNVLEFAAGAVNGSYSSNNFASTGQTNILSGGTGTGIVTNMVDPGGATNRPSRYYRVRVLAP